MYFSLALVYIFFNVPQDFTLSLLSLYVIVTPIILASKILYPWALRVNESYLRVVQGGKHVTMAKLICFIIVLSMPLDILVNGFKLLDPLSYAEFHGYGRYIRHISSLCWILVPVAFVFVKRKGFRWMFVMAAIIFPILIIDRNRLFLAFYSIIFCIVASMPATEHRLSKKTSIFYVFALIIVILMVFGLLGMFRSGDAFLVDSSGSVLEEGALPLNDLFFYLPDIFKQIVIYLTTPIFNFSTIVYYEFTNHEFLLSQLSPFDRDLFDTYPDAPVMVKRFNVGTEFYPWLLYGGLPLVALSYVFMALTFFCVVHIFKKYANIFTLLIFLKISYVVLFSGFAPQFYLLMNLIFIVTMLFLWFSSRLLRI